MNIEGRTASFEIREHRYYAAIWWLDLPPALSEFKRGGNLMVMLWREETDAEHWHLQWRFRHYRDERVWQSADTRNGFESTFKGNETAALALVNKWLGVVSTISGSEVIHIPVAGNNEAVAQAMARHPDIFHLRLAEPEGAQHS